MEAKRLVEEKTAMLRKKMIAMKECEKKLQKDKSVDSSNMMIPDKQYEHMRNMMPNSHFPEALTGELLVPLGFPQAITNYTMLTTFGNYPHILIVFCHRFLLTHIHHLCRSRT